MKAYPLALCLVSLRVAVAAYEPAPQLKMPDLRRLDGFVPAIGVVAVVGTTYDLDAEVSLDKNEVKDDEKLKKTLKSVFETYLEKSGLFDGIGGGLKKVVARMKFNSSLPKSVEFLQGHATKLTFSFKSEEDIQGKRLAACVAFDHKGHKVLLAQFVHDNRSAVAVQIDGRYELDNNKKPRIFYLDGDGADQFKDWFEERLK